MRWKINNLKIKDCTNKKLMKRIQIYLISEMLKNVNIITDKNN